MTKRTNLFFLISLLIVNFALSQDQPTDSLVIFDIADTAPEPIGGMTAIYKWFSEQKSETIFNRTDTLDCSSFRVGKVYIGFIIEKNGELTNSEVLKSLDVPYDTFCLNVVNSMPIEWEPGTKDDQPVRVRMVLPFKFCKSNNHEIETKKRKRKKRN